MFLGGEAPRVAIYGSDNLPISPAEETNVTANRADETYINTEQTSFINPPSWNNLCDGVGALDVRFYHNARYFIFDDDAYSVFLQKLRNDRNFAQWYSQFAATARENNIDFRIFVNGSEQTNNANFSHFNNVISRIDVVLSETITTSSVLDSSTTVSEQRIEYNLSQENFVAILNNDSARRRLQELAVECRENGYTVIFNVEGRTITLGDALSHYTYLLGELSIMTKRLARVSLNGSEEIVIELEEEDNAKELADLIENNYRATFTFLLECSRKLGLDIILTLQGSDERVNLTP